MLDGPCSVPGLPEQVVKPGPDQGVGHLGGVGRPDLKDRGRHVFHGPPNQVTVVVGAAKRSEDNVPVAVLQPELHGRPQGREVLVLLLVRVRVRPASAQGPPGLVQWFAGVDSAVHRAENCWLSIHLDS